MVQPIYVNPRHISTALSVSPSSVSVRYLSQLLGCAPLQEYLQGALDSPGPALVAAWFRCCMLLSPGDTTLHQVTRYVENTVDERFHGYLVSLEHSWCCTGIFVADFCVAFSSHAHGFTGCTWQLTLWVGMIMILSDAY